MTETVDNVMAESLHRESVEPAIDEQGVAEHLVRALVD
jgi:hypothetical protein